MQQADRIPDFFSGTYQKADGIIFHVPHLAITGFHHQKLPNQTWISFSMENVELYPFLKGKDGHGFLMKLLRQKFFECH
jgi:hypothetical protein